MRCVSVIVPVYRSRSTLEALVDRIHAALSEQTHEIVFVDDCCPEHSGRALESIARRDPSLRVVHMDRNSGQARATLRGMGEAKGDRIVVMDADLQDPPEAISALIAKLDRGKWDAVFAGRRGAYQGALRMATSKVYRFALTRMCGLPPDAGGYYAITAEVARSIRRYQIEHPYLPAMIAYAARRVSSIPVARDKRERGRSAYTTKARVRVAWTGFRTAMALRGMR